MIGSYAQNHPAYYQKEPVKNGDTLTTDYFPNLRHVFILEYNFYQGWYSDTMRFKKDSSLFTGVLCINMWTMPYEGKVVPSTTSYLTYNYGILEKEISQEYSVTAFYKHKDPVIFYGIKRNCYGPYQIEKPDSMSVVRIHKTTSSDKVSDIDCYTEIEYYFSGQVKRIQTTTSSQQTTRNNIVELHTNGDTIMHSYSKNDSITIQTFFFYRDSIKLTMEIEKSTERINDIKADKAILIGNKKNIIGKSEFLKLNSKSLGKFGIMMLTSQESWSTGYDFIVYNIENFNPYRKSELNRILKKLSKH